MQSRNSKGPGMIVAKNLNAKMSSGNTFLGYDKGEYPFDFDG